MAIAATTSGKVEGDEHGGTLVFRAIPYAAPPVGDRRFRPPAPVDAWDGVRPAVEFGPMCPQLPSMMDEFFGTKGHPHSEDCLTLNVWTPACDDGARPVLVWIHGGAFTTGTAATPWYSGTQFALGGAVLVTINYRLGALGFTHLGHLSDAFPGAGNLGLLDQVAALEWVRDNIAGFGGDPSNVTIFGESAGGCAVVALLALPVARGLFHRAIAQSASFTQLRSRARAEEATDELLAAAGLRPDQVDELHRLPITDLIAAQGTVLARPAKAFTAFSPTPDGDVLPGEVLDLLAAGAAADVSMVIGTTRDEMQLFTFMDPTFAALTTEQLATRVRPEFGLRTDDAIAAYAAARPGATPGGLASAIATDQGFRLPVVRLAEQRAALGAPTFVYLFRWPSPSFGGILGSCHGLEIPFVFDNIHQHGVEVMIGDGPDREPLADAVHGAWLAFSRSGDPSHGAIGDWPAYDGARRATMVFDTPTGIESDPEGELRRLWP